jgi:hypothetical protein
MCCKHDGEWYSNDNQIKVDDLMISHLSQDEIMKAVQEITNIYDENLMENVGTMHDCLKMIFDYLFPKEVRINM